jgi:hypothetical protein
LRINNAAANCFGFYRRLFLSAVVLKLQFLSLPGRLQRQFFGT